MMSSAKHNAVAKKNNSEMVKWAELPLAQESSHSITSTQPIDRMEDDVMIDIEAMIGDSEEGQLSPTCCVYRVPHSIRKIKQEDYTPEEKKHLRHSFNEVENHFLLYSANELQEAGVKFKASTSKCLLELKFAKGVLEIPHIFVEDTTESLFRNMMALEQWHYPEASYITDYTFVLDCLINTNKDVDVLIHRKIIYNYLADGNDVANLFNGLCKSIGQLNFNSYYVDIWKRLNSFCQDPWNKMKATLNVITATHLGKLLPPLLELYSLFSPLFKPYFLYSR